jgi:F-type H+-transporting ATPase subunit delta
MLILVVAKNYAKALFLAAKKAGNLEKVNQELDVFKKYFNADFAHELKNPTISKEDLVKIMQEIAKKLNFSNLVTDFFAVVAENKRLNLFVEIYEAFVKLVQKEQNILVAELISAHKMEISQIEEIKAIIAKKYADKKIIIAPIIKENILGGFQIKIGTNIIDASLKNQIAVIASKCKKTIN